MDALELLTRDHRDGEILFDHYRAATTFDERRNLVYEVTGHLSQHTVVEERMLYPLLARVISVPSISMPVPGMMCTTECTMFSWNWRRR